MVSRPHTINRLCVVYLLHIMCKILVLRGGNIHRERDATSHQGTHSSGEENHGSSNIGLFPDHYQGLCGGLDARTLNSVDPNTFMIYQNLSLISFLSSLLQLECQQRRRFAVPKIIMVQLLRPNPFCIYEKGNLQYSMGPGTSSQWRQDEALNQITSCLC